MNAQQKLDHHKHHPVKVYRNDDKNRFGHPISNPTLADDIKGVFSFLQILYLSQGKKTSFMLFV